MKSFDTGTSVTQCILFSRDGVAFEPTSGAYRVLDGAGQELVPETSFVLDDPAPPSMDITIPAIANNLVGRPRGIRVVEVVFQTAEGQITIAQSYMLMSPYLLDVPSESFVSYWGAQEVASSLLEVNGFLNATRDMQMAALMQSKLALERFRFRYEHPDMRRVQPRILISDMAYITESEFNALPAEFRLALARAQVIEASELLLAGSSYIGTMERLRAMGVRSHTVGESSATFGNGPISKPSVSHRAKAMLKPYIDTAIRIGRA